MGYKDGFPKFQAQGRVDDVWYPMRRDIEFFDEFTATGAADFTTAAGNGSKYKVAGTNAAVVATTNIACLTNNDGGWLQLTTTGVSGDALFAGPTAGFLYTISNAGDPRPVVFSCRMSPNAVSAATQGCGLVTATSMTGATEPITNQAFGFYFAIVNGAVQVSYKTSAVTSALAAVTYLEGGVVPILTVSSFTTTNTTITAGSAVTVAAGTAATFGIRFDGVSKLKFYVNGLLVKDVTLAAFTGLSLAPFWGTKTTAAATTTCLVDYVFAGVGQNTIGRT